MEDDGTSPSDVRKHKKDKSKKEKKPKKDKKKRSSAGGDDGSNDDDSDVDVQLTEELEGPVAKLPRLMFKVSAPTGSSLPSTPSESTRPAVLFSPGSPVSAVSPPSTYTYSSSPVGTPPSSSSPAVAIPGSLPATVLAAIDSTTPVSERGSKRSKKSIAAAAAKEAAVATEASARAGSIFTRSARDNVFDEFSDDDDEEETADGKKMQRLLMPSVNKAPSLDTDVVSKFFIDSKGNDHNFHTLKLKHDHAARPLWVASNGHIFLESFSPIYQQAYDFLIAIAEPLSRPEHVHEYLLTAFSLYAASSVGLQTDDIISVLNRLSKVPVPEGIETFIRMCTDSYGKVKLVLKENRYWVESSYRDVLQKLLKDSVIGPSRKIREGTIGEGISVSQAPSRRDIKIPGVKDSSAAPTPAAGASSSSASAAAGAPAGPSGPPQQAVAEDIYQAMLELDKEDPDEFIDGERRVQVHSFEIEANKVEGVKKRCIELDYPVLEEYDFRNDNLNPNLDMDLKPSTLIRPYQEKSLSKMFGDGRARSGIIVLPCGAGKTLVGVTAACTIKKSVLVLCTSVVSVEQWRYQFRTWSTIKDNQIGRFSSQHKENWKEAGFAAGITVTTYNMMATSGNRSYETESILDLLLRTEWGLVILDEVHVTPADTFRKAVSSFKAHCKMGLTATPLREDNKIGSLNYLIGPKLYEANWMDLSKQGFIANVQCAEVWCPMTPEFYREYLSADARKRKLLFVMNPTKFQACQYLIRTHEERGDKIIVFSDNLYALKSYAKRLKKPFIYGKTPQNDRMEILQQFQTNPMLNCIFLSKIGDTSIDLPEATCLIQISSHYGSRRQEAQRLGRILRAKRRNDEGFNAFFYTLVSQDTQEMYYSTKRQEFLNDQGYAFKVITELADIESVPDLVASTKREQMELLKDVMTADEKGDEDDDSEMPTGRGRKSAIRRQGRINALSGANNLTYMEITKSGGSGSSSSTSNKVSATFKRAK